MFLSPEVVSWSIAQLRERCHPFIGITFLACKKAGMPVGSTIHMSLDAATKRHLEVHHKLAPSSECYFQPFKSNRGFWVSSKYPSAGLQAINTQTFRDAFLHPRRSQRWGLVDGYVETIRNIVGEAYGHGLPSLAALAVWIEKSERWDSPPSVQAVIERFLNEFSISEEEKDCLFDVGKNPPSSIPVTCHTPLDLEALAHSLQIPPDAPSRTEGTLTSIRLARVGPARMFELDFGDRLTLIAGDNGLGKSFLLDSAWWALTGRWAGRPAFPLGIPGATASSIRYTVRNADGQVRLGGSTFDWTSHTWRDLPDRPSLTGLYIYSKVDGTFAISDEVRGRLQGGDTSSLNSFSTREVWDGKEGQIEGMVRDWVSWQLASHSDSFLMLSRVLEHLSPDDIGPLLPSEPVRLPGDPRRIPTIKNFYGNVPIVVASAGVKRILLLAYLIIWMWQEHLLASNQVGVPPQRKMVIVVDELEAHLHPRWQRLVLPALMSVGKLLSDKLEVQVIAATHSPMVLASVEEEFSENSDVLAHLSVVDRCVTLNSIDFYKYGDVSSWLTSPIFGLTHARSRAAEKVIEEAKALQLSSEPITDDVRVVTDRLKRLLSPDDVFWSRWIYFAKQLGVDV